MSFEVSVRGIGLVGGFGHGASALREACSRTPHPNEVIEVESQEGRHHVPAYRADISTLEEIMGWRVLRRVDRFSQLVILAAHLALEDAGLARLDRRRVGIILATGYGSADTTFRFHGSCIDDGPGLASPLLFSSSGNSAPVSNLSILLEITGPVLTICQPDLAVAQALVSATNWLREGRVDAVLVGGADECFDVRSYVWQQLYRDRPSQHISPLDFGNDSAIMGEGAAFGLLTRAADGDATRPRCTGIVQGHLDDSLPEFDGCAALLLCAAGHSRCGSGYRRALQSSGSILPPVAVFSPVFGSLPSALAMNLAIATLACGGETIPVPLHDSANPEKLGTAAELGQSPLAVLECRGNGAWATVFLSPAQPRRRPRAASANATDD